MLTPCIPIPGKSQFSIGDHKYEVAVWQEENCVVGMPGFVMPVWTGDHIIFEDGEFVLKLTKAKFEEFFERVYD